MEMRRQGLSADVFITSVSALTKEGELYAVDLTGSRTGGFLSSKNLIVVTGSNKIVADHAHAVQRTREFCLVVESARVRDVSQLHTFLCVCACCMCVRLCDPRVCTGFQAAGVADHQYCVAQRQEPFCAAATPDGHHHQGDGRLLRMKSCVDAAHMLDMCDHNKNMHNNFLQHACKLGSRPSGGGCPAAKGSRV